MNLKKTLFTLLLITLFVSCTTYTDNEVKNIAVKFLDGKLASPELLDYKIERGFKAYQIEVNATKNWKIKHSNAKDSFPFFIEIDVSSGEVVTFL